MKGKLLVIGLVAALLLAVAGMIAAMDMQASGPAARYLPAGTSPSDLPEPESEGAKLVARHCQACHSVPLPSLHYAEDWQEVIARMRVLAMSRVMAPLPVATPAEERALLAYYQRHAPKPPAAAAAAAAAAEEP